MGKLFEFDEHIGKWRVLVQTRDIANGAVTEPKMADLSISTRTLQDKSVTEPKLDDDSVSTRTIIDKNVTEQKMADNSVSTRTIIDKNVTEQKMADNSVSRRTIQEHAINNEKIDDDAIETRHIKDENVTWEKLDENTKNIVVTGGGQHGIPLSTEFGDSDIVGITQKTLTESRDSLQNQINEIVSGGATVSLAASPSGVFANTATVVTLTATSDQETSHIAITKRGETEPIAEGESSPLTGQTTINQAAGSIYYDADFVISGLHRAAQRLVNVVNHIYFGSGTAYTDAATARQDAVTSPAGTYNVQVGHNLDYVYFNVPATMTINRATMSGFDFPLEAPTTVQIDGVDYKSYRSSNTYDAGTLTIILS